LTPDPKDVQNLSFSAKLKTLPQTGILQKSRQGRIHPHQPQNHPDTAKSSIPAFTCSSARSNTQGAALRGVPPEATGKQKAQPDLPKQVNPHFDSQIIEPWMPNRHGAISVAEPTR
jgi:hypothetical protein